MALIAAGCSNNNTATNQFVNGQFIDEVVAGLDYSCSSGIQGVTNQKGNYACDKSDSITFSINGFILGSTAVSNVITPNDITLDSSQAINVVQLLQTLDSDNNSSNGISIARLGAQYNALENMRKTTYGLISQTLMR